MDFLWFPPPIAHDGPPRVWIYLHGASCSLTANEAPVRQHAADAGVHLFLPQGTRPADPGFWWSFAADATALVALLDHQLRQRGLVGARTDLIGHSMGCTMALWLLMQDPARYHAVALLGMGSAFERWEHDDGGIAYGRLRTAAAHTRVLLAVDLHDPAGGPPHVAGYYQQNHARLHAEGFAIESFRPDLGTHAVTPPMQDRVAAFLRD